MQTYSERNQASKRTEWPSPQAWAILLLETKLLIYLNITEQTTSAGAIAQRGEIEMPLGISELRSVLCVSNREIGALEEVILAATLKAICPEIDNYEIRTHDRDAVYNPDEIRKAMAELDDVAIIVIDETVSDTDVITFMVSFIDTDVIFLQPVVKDGTLVAYNHLEFEITET